MLLRYLNDSSIEPIYRKFSDSSVDFEYPNNSSSSTWHYSRISHDLTDNQIRTLEIATTVSSSLSLIASFSMMIAIVFWKDVKRYTNPLVLWLAVSDMIASIWMVMGRYPIRTQHSELCVAQGMFLYIFEMASTLWITCISINLLFVFVIKNNNKIKQRKQFIFHFLSWGLPTLAAILLQIYFSSPEKPVFSDSTYWCWVGAHHPHVRLAVVYIPIWLLFFVNVGVYLYVGMLLKRYTERVSKDPESSIQVGSTKNSHSNKIKETRTIYFKTAASYMLGYMIIWTPSTINRIYRGFNPSKPYFSLFLLNAILSPSYGLVNSLVYFWQRVASRKTKTNQNNRESKTNNRETEHKSADGHHHHQDKTSKTYSATTTVTTPTIIVTPSTANTSRTFLTASTPISFPEHFIIPKSASSTL